MDSWTRLVDIVTALEVEYVEGESAWIGSPFAWIKTRPSRQVGAIGEKIVAAILEIDGHSVARSPDSDADRVVDGHRLEIKFSTLWRNGGYKFQQIRDQNYEAAICFGVSPQEAHLWYFPKAVLYDYVIGHTGQHGGSTGLRLLVDGEADERRFLAVPGVVSVAREGPAIDVVVEGSVDGVLKVAATMTVKRISTPGDDLAEMFMAFYGGEAAQ